MIKTPIGSFISWTIEVSILNIKPIFLPSIPTLPAQTHLTGFSNFEKQFYCKLHDNLSGELQGLGHIAPNKSCPQKHFHTMFEGRQCIWRIAGRRLLPGTIIDFSYSCRTQLNLQLARIHPQPGTAHSLLVGISELTQTPSEASIAKLIGRKKLKMKI